MHFDTLPAYVNHWAEQIPNNIWLRDLGPDNSETTWTWAQAAQEIHAVAAALEARFGSGNNMVLLSRNCAHWVMADHAMIASGNVVTPMFTTLPASTAEYVLDFVDAKVIFVGETSNWDAVSAVLPKDITLVALPGANLTQEHISWEALVEEGRSKPLNYECKADDLISLVFTSGTTGVPKGVMQNHSSNLKPICRFIGLYNLDDNPRFFSYLPLSHIAERQIVGFASVVLAGEIYFNQSLDTLLPDLQRTRPHVFFGPPRVWEQIQQALLAKFGSQEAVEQALAQDKKGIGELVIAGLGLDQVQFCLAAAAPVPPALVHWFEEFGLIIIEGFGQTEAMGMVLNTYEDRRVGSIGKPVGEVEYKITEEGELLLKSEGLTPGYYKMPEKTAELFQNGWLHTGDKARVDEDGFIYLTGRVKDYFKTIQGKFVAPTPLENEFGKSELVEQLCLLGRGYSKTVMVVVLSEAGKSASQEDVDAEMQHYVETVNNTAEHHARIGAVIITTTPWTIDNEVLTPTMKLKRETIEERYGETARELALASAQQKTTLLHWWSEG